MHLVFADESGTSVAEPCYTIGALAIDAEYVDEFRNLAIERARQHGVQGEVKWTKVAKSHGLINFGLQMFGDVLAGKCRFNAIVVRKDICRKWANDKESAFYTTYTELLNFIAAGLGEDLDVSIDFRQDAYGKQHEVVEIVSNHMLTNLASKGRLRNVTKKDSKTEIGLQVADFLTGAINASHRAFLDPGHVLSPGRVICISRLARMIGWTKLHFDTFPNVHVNIWHFPIEWRAMPATKEVKIAPGVPFLSAQELSAAYKACAKG